MRIITGDCMDKMQALDENSIHAVVTDPPYGLAFMGNSWDDFEPKEYQEWCEQWATECLRVLKPGGHLLSFSGTRTYHRLGVGVEDAGFEIRDKIDWLYGSGFPKALDVSKAIDKAAGAEREVVGEKTAPDGVPLKDRVSHSGEEYDEDSTDYGDCKRDVYERAPATDAAEQWDGFKTALKPAHEPVCVARKPFNQTVAENVLEHGTGALNIDGCRIGSEQRENPPTSHNDNCYGDVGDRPTESVEGRYPSNVVFDERAAEGLDREVGELDSGGPAQQGNSYSYHTNK
ncbi:MAG TPA: DNA methyltransferase, partial [Candidatus Paceibacterota bacterium]|nr:DNA methyltransferase [Candidatus Paceibacterota bacterium]